MDSQTPRQIEDLIEHEIALSRFGGVMPPGDPDPGEPEPNPVLKFRRSKYNPKSDHADSYYWSHRK